MKLKNFFTLTWRKTAIAFLMFILFVFLHNLVSGLLRIEEPFFFLLAVIGIPLYFIISIVYTLIVKFRKK